MIYRKAFTLIEILVTVAIISILVAIAAPAISNSISDSKSAAGEASAKTYNQAIMRIGLKGDIPDVLTGSDQDAAISYLISNGWLN